MVSSSTTTMGCRRGMKTWKTVYFLTVVLIFLVKGLSAGKYKMSLLLLPHGLIAAPEFGALACSCLFLVSSFTYFQISNVLFCGFKYFSDEEQHVSDGPELKVRHQRFDNHQSRTWKTGTWIHFMNALNVCAMQYRIQAYLETLSACEVYSRAAQDSCGQIWLLLLAVPFRGHHSQTSTSI